MKNKYIKPHTALQEKSENEIYELYSILSDKFSQPEYAWYAHAYISAALSSFSFAKKEQLERGIAFLRKRINEREKSRPFYWAKDQAKLGASLGRLWEETNDIGLQ